MNDSLPDLAALRAKAKSLRAEADEIDRRVDDFVAWAGGVQTTSRTNNTAVANINTAAAPSNDPPRADATQPRRGKPPGTMSMKWRNHFANVRLFDGVEFPLSAIMQHAKREDGSDQRPTALRRHMKPYIEHGYLAEAGPDVYRMTTKLEELLDKLEERASGSDNSSPQGETGGVAPPVSTNDDDTAACLTATGGGT